MGRADLGRARRFENLGRGDDPFDLTTTVPLVHHELDIGVPGFVDPDPTDVVSRPSAAT